LETGELERQIEEMHKAGIGGFFMHARGGLLTPYMGEEWMSAVRTCIEKCKELGMSPWLYDENGWPSGFADGKVPAKGIAYQQKRLVYEHTPFQNPAERTIALYAKSEQGYRLLSAAEENSADVRLHYEVNPYYIDTLSTEAVRAFIESTYEAYWDRFGEEFGEDLGVQARSPYSNGERNAVYTNGPFVLTEPPALVQTGDLVCQGFPFFAGKIHLQQKVDIDWKEWTAAKWRFSAPPDTIVSRLFVNGQEVRSSSGSRMRQTLLLFLGWARTRSNWRWLIAVEICSVLTITSMASSIR
jgi:hypothetical protein